MNHNQQQPQARRAPAAAMEALPAARRAAAAPRQDEAASSSSPTSNKRTKHDPTMTLTSAELTRAREIKAALLEKPNPYTAHLHPSKRPTASDYDVAQLALSVGRQTLPQIVERCHRWQAFCAEYKLVLPSSNASGNPAMVEEGLGLISEFMNRFPGYILSVDFAPRYGSYILVMDMRAFDMTQIVTMEDWRLYLGAFYYIFLCLSTNLKAIRAGVVFIGECEGCREENFVLEGMERFVSHLFWSFPFHYKECLWLNTPTAANMAYACLKGQVPPEFRRTWRLGCKLDGYSGRIDTLFKVPTTQIAQEQVLSRIEEFLTERCRNASAFSLETAVVQEPPPRPPGRVPRQAVPRVDWNQIAEENLAVQDAMDRRNNQAALGRNNNVPQQPPHPPLQGHRQVP